MFIKEAHEIGTLLKIYIPLLLAIIYFSGFNYINEFYRFFGLVGIYREFSLAEFAINAYFVVKELLLFSYFWASTLFFAFLICVLLVIVLPKYQYNFPNPTNLLYEKLHGQAVFSAFGRLIFLLLLAFYVMNECSRLVGAGHGCVKLSKSRSTINLVGYGDLKRKPNEIDEEAQKILTQDLKHLLGSNKMIEVWADDKFVFLSKKTNECGGIITTFKVPHNMYLYSVTSHD